MRKTKIDFLNVGDMEVLGCEEAVVNVNGKPHKWGDWHADIAMNKDEKLEAVKILLKSGYGVGGAIYDEPGETEEFDCETEADVDKYAEEYDVYICWAPDKDDNTKIRVYADYISDAAIVAGEKSGVKKVLEILGLDTDSISWEYSVHPSYF